ncbi:MAG: DUF4430 domain-containing protein [Oscillospiraceae bacterium]|nr:DUF4430 domain-containing protein [Oscillospiraceae bacterium]
MTKTSLKKMLSSILCSVLIAATALITTGCNSNTADVEETSAAITSSQAAQEAAVLGEGATKFTFTVTDGTGSETSFEIHTDKTNVGEVLLEHGLIAGDTSEYGLYVKTVNGITADYDTDGTYWAFYIDGEYAMTGVDSTEITDGAVYSFKVEK